MSCSIRPLLEMFLTVGFAVLAMTLVFRYYFAEWGDNALHQSKKIEGKLDEIKRDISKK